MLMVGLALGGGCHALVEVFGLRMVKGCCIVLV